MDAGASVERSAHLSPFELDHAANGRGSEMVPSSGSTIDITSRGCGVAACTVD